MTKCDRYQDLLMRYFDHELTRRDQEVLDRHLHSCRDCRALHQDLTGILSTLENAVLMEPDADLERRVLDRIVSMPAGPERDRDPLRKVAYGTLAGLAAVFLLMFALSFQSMGYVDLIMAARDYAYWSSAFLVNLQIAYEIVSGLLPVDVLEAAREILAISVLAVFVLLLVAVKTVFARLAAENPDVP